MLWLHYKNKLGEYAIKIRVCINNTEKYYPVGVSVLKTEWNGKRVKPIRKNHKEINDKIVHLEGTIESALIKNKNADIDKIIKGDIENDDFYYYVKKRLDFIEQKYVYLYFQSNQIIFNKLKKFKPVLKLNELTFDFMRSYEKHLIELGNGANTIHNNFVRIRTLVNELVDSGVIPYAKNPFLQFKTKKQKTNKTRLSYENILKLETQPNCIALDMYMFSFYCAGIRFGDLCRLKQSNVVNGRLDYTMNKTTVKRSIILLKPALKILSRYKKKGFIFRQLVDGLNHIQETKMIASKNAYLNKRLKFVCKAAEVPNISFHTSRNSFADLAKNKGMGIHSIKELLGHSTTATTEIYMKGFYKEETDADMETIFKD